MQGIVARNNTAFPNAKVLNGKDPSRGSTIFNLPPGTLVTVQSESVNCQGWSEIVSIDWIPVDVHGNHDPFLADNSAKMPDANWNKLIGEWVGAGFGGKTVWGIGLPDLQPAPIPAPKAGVDPAAVKAAISAIQASLDNLAKLVS